MTKINFINLGIPELIILLIALFIPILIVIFVVSYFRKQTRLKEEQNRLLQKIADNQSK
jgi:hypothetical protein